MQINSFQFFHLGDLDVLMKLLNILDFKQNNNNPIKNNKISMIKISQYGSKDNLKSNFELRKDDLGL